MNIHRTTDPANRSADIADRVAWPVWQQTGDYRQWYNAWMSAYEQALAEFVGHI